MKQVLKTILILLMISTVMPVYADIIDFELSLDRDYVEVGDIVVLGLSFENTQDLPPPELPEIDGFKTQYMGPTTRVSMINGRTSSMMTHRYKMIAIKPGAFSLGPFSFEFKSNEYRSNARKIQVVDRAQAPARPFAGNAGISEENLDGNIFLITSVDKNKAYLNERVLVKIKLYVSQLNVRDVQYPVLEGQGYMMEGLDDYRKYQEEVSGQIYSVVEFNTVVYPTKEGKTTIGPAKLKCNVVSPVKRNRRSSGLDGFFDRDFFDDSMLGDFFGRMQVFPMNLKSAELVLDVEPFPRKNKPGFFNGAVGTFKIDVEAKPKELRAGDPITLKITVTGEGNFDSVKSPVLSDERKFKTYKSEAKKVQAGKIFEQVIIPQDEEIASIPAIKFAYFDPRTEQYKTLEHLPIPIAVMPPAENKSKIVAMDTQAEDAPSRKVLGKDIVFIKEKAPRFNTKGNYLHRNRGFWFLHIFPLLFSGIAVVFKRRRQKLKTDIEFARKLRAPRIARSKIKQAKNYLLANDPSAFYDQIFKTLQEYLGHRFNRPSAGITAEVIDELKLHKKIAENFKACFSDCDLARYAAEQFNKEKMARTLSNLEESIDYLERRKR